MFDDLRKKSAEDAEFLKEEEAPAEPAPAAAAETTIIRRPQRRVARRGLTPAQGFLLALMLFLNVSVLGCLALLVFDKVWLPWF